MKKIILLLSVLIISGCVGMPDFFSGLTGTQKTKVKEQPLDVITVQNINTLPKPPINAGDQFSISFDVTNLEEERDIKSVAYKLLDTGLCNRISGDPKEKNFTLSSPFVPKQDEFVEWTFSTPSAADLAYINSKCPVRFKVNYSFDAISEIEADIISEGKYNQLQQSGGFQTFVPTLNMGRGPLRILMEFGASLPVKTGVTLPLYVTVEDKGTGLYATIPRGDLTIKVPEDFVLETPSCGERFECSGKECYNNETIMMIERKSPTFRYSFKTPNTVTIEKVYNIEAFLNYTYDITNQVDVDIKTPSGI